MINDDASDFYNELCELHDKYSDIATEWIKVRDTAEYPCSGDSIDRDKVVKSTAKVDTYLEVCSEIALLMAKYEHLQRQCSNCSSLYIKDMTTGCCNNPESKKGVVAPSECCDLHEFREKK